MRKIGIFVAALILTTGAFGQITGSAHDFAATGWANGEICIACHTPHNALAVTDGPLWNHDVTATVFTVFSSVTLDAAIGQPSGVSKLCLSCHDGTVALDSFGGAIGATFIAANADFGSDLSNDHPISFTYDTALATADGELFDPATDPSGLAGGTTIDADMLFGGSMECASCHDVHNAYGNVRLLVKSNAASALCFTCHDK